MTNINDLIRELANEGFNAQLIVRFSAKARAFSAELVSDEDNQPLLDRNGDKFLRAEAASMSEAVAELDKLCG